MVINMKYVLIARFVPVIKRIRALNGRGYLNIESGFELGFELRLEPGFEPGFEPGTRS